MVSLKSGSKNKVIVRVSEPLRDKESGRSSISQLIFTMGKIHEKFVLPFQICAKVTVRVRVWLP